MKEKETSFRTTKIGSTIYKTVFDDESKTYKQEKLIVTELLIIPRVRSCPSEKRLTLNNGDIIYVQTTAYYKIEYNKLLISYYTTNKITANNIIQQHIDYCGY